MKFPSPLIPGRLIRRYKRFLADIELADGETITAHCANPGSMLNSGRAGSRVLLSRSENPKRKLPYSWELVRVGRTWACINTARTNAIVREAIEEGLVPELVGFDELRSEVPCGENSRIDFRLCFGQTECYVEVKNVTLVEKRIARFPDAVTERGTKHLHELTRMAGEGCRAVMFYLINRGDGDSLEPAADIDPVYAHALAEAVEGGVEVLSYRARVTRQGITVDRRVPFRLRATRG